MFATRKLDTNPFHRFIKQQFTNKAAGANVATMKQAMLSSRVLAKPKLKTNFV